MSSISAKIKTEGGEFIGYWSMDLPIPRVNERIRLKKDNSHWIVINVEYIVGHDSDIVIIVMKN